MLEPDERNAGERAQHKTNQEFMSTVACEGEAGPEDDWNHCHQAVADRRTEQGQRRCRERCERDVQRQFDPRRQKSGKQKKPGRDEQAADKKRSRVAEEKPAKRSDQASQGDDEQNRPFRWFRGVDIRPSAPMDLAEHEHSKWNDDANDH